MPFIQNGVNFMQCFTFVIVLREALYFASLGKLAPNERAYLGALSLAVCNVAIITH